jgi:hypothetical protein
MARRTAATRVESAYLVVDVLHVVLRGPMRNPEKPPDLWVRAALHAD